MKSQVCLKFLQKIALKKKMNAKDVLGSKKVGLEQSKY